MHHPKVLFIVKERKVYGTKTACYGLVNSCQFVANELVKHGIHAKVVQVVDNNGIDKEVHQFKPTHCFIEAIWVVPSKFEVLAKLHPKVKWNIRIHSMVPFLVSEGMCFDWINDYQKLRTEKGINIHVSCNNKKLHEDLSAVYEDIGYTPNIYKPEEIVPDNLDFGIVHSPDVLNIGCFGALRILKNHCQQACWSIEYANKIGKILYFHVNVSSHETNETSPVLKNLRAIFDGSGHHLVEHTWMPHEDFMALVREMDFGLQLSFTETFNIVAADFVNAGIPVVVSTEISFINPFLTVNPSDRHAVMKAMNLAYNGYCLTIWDKFLLEKQNKLATKQWLEFLHVKKH
jgi:hypothetical protein